MASVALMVTLLCAFPLTSLAGAVPAVRSLSVAQSSLEAHHTSFYQIEKGFAVRRGQSFDMVVETDSPVDISTSTFYLAAEGGDAATHNLFAVTLKESLGGSRYALSVSTHASAPVGKYQPVTLTIRMPEYTMSFVYKDPIYLIFNPWAQDDVSVFIPSEEMRREYVLTEYGNVYHPGNPVTWGDQSQVDYQKWHYGHSNQITLDAVFHLLKKLTSRESSDATTVLQALSRNQGMMRKPSGEPMVGNEDALLEGNWTGPFENTTDPMSWSSVTDILKRWRSTGRPAKYGQCWIFAALLNTLVRAVGIGSRQLIAFGAVIDASAGHDHAKKAHHVVDTYYDTEGNQIYVDGMNWNFHSWIEVYLNREDTTRSGWHSMDGTPPGNIGPASTADVKALREGADYNVSSEISNVHSTQRSFLAQCDAQHKKGDKLNHCKVVALLSYDPAGLKLLTSSKTLENGTTVMDNITHSFVDPSRDAFIPYDEKDATWPAANVRPPLMAGDSLLGVRATFRRLSGTDEPVRGMDMLLRGTVSILPKTRDIIVGDSIEGVVVFETAHLVQGDSLQLNLAFALETYQGVVMRTLKSTQERVLVKGDRIEVPWVLEGHAYLQRDLSNVFVTVVALGWTSDNNSFFAKDVFDIDSPAVTISLPTVELASTAGVSTEAAFTNPLDFDLKNVCVTIHSHDLRFEGLPFHATHLTRCVDLRAHETLELKAQFVTPCKPDSCVVMASVAGDYLPTVTSSAELSSVMPGARSQFASALSLVAASSAVVILVVSGVGACRQFRGRQRAPVAWLNAEGTTATARTELQETA